MATGAFIRSNAVCTVSMLTAIVGSLLAFVNVIAGIPVSTKTIDACAIIGANVVCTDGVLAAFVDSQLAFVDI